LIVKLLIGSIVSAAFVYFTLRGVNLHEVWAGLHGKAYMLLLPAGLTFIACQITRSIRWGVILSPLKSISQRRLFPLTSVGFMAIIVAPMRLGELVRPYLASAKEGVPMVSGIATILVERVMDLTVLLLFLFFVLSQVSLPRWFLRGGILLLLVVATEFVAIAVFLIWPRAVTRALCPITTRLPRQIGQRIDGFVHNLSVGFAVISDLGRFLKVFVLSFVVWGLSALAVYLLFLFCGFPFGVTEALAVTTITALGISLPAAPGLIGNFQFACMVALSFRGVPKTDAFVYAMVYYCLGVGINLVLGVLFMTVLDFPINRIFGLNRVTKEGKELSEASMP
jgi:hypothetical protein